MPEANDARTAFHLSVSYMIAVTSEIMRTSPLDQLDLLIVGTVLTYNVSSPDGAAPKWGIALSDPGLRGISRNAVSRAIGVPLETVRRRVGTLIEMKVLLEHADGLILAADNPLGLGADDPTAAYNLTMLRQLFADLKARGVALD